MEYAPNLAWRDSLTRFLSEDFCSSWLHKINYNFLAILYLESPKVVALGMPLLAD